MSAAIVLCHACAKARGARGAHASDYVERADVGLWRARCDDCGRVGSTGDASGIAAFRIVRDAGGRSAVG